VRGPSSYINARGAACPSRVEFFFSMGLRINNSTSQKVDFSFYKKASVGFGN